MRRTTVILTLLLAGAGALHDLAANPPRPVRFRVRIENVSNGRTLTPSSGSSRPVLVSAGVWAVHNELGPFFTTGKPDRGKGLESLAEDGDPAALSRSLATQDGVLSTGVFDTPSGSPDPGPIVAGGAYEFTVTAAPGARFSFAVMFMESNDLFFAPDETGIGLFDASDRPIAADVTDSVLLWDAGTEVHQEPGLGAFQASRQPRRQTGFDEHATVKPVQDGFTYPRVTDVLRVTVTPKR